MKHFNTLLFLFILAFTIIGCSSDDNSKNTEVRIRLSNVSPFDYKNITVNTISFDQVNSGEKTAYKTFEIAYRYGFIELEIDGATHTIQPIDYVGETPLKNGDYTYQISANDSKEQYGKLDLTLVED